MKHSTEFYERQYNARAMIPEHPAIFARWAEAAAVNRRLRACLLDLPYGESAAERLDLFPARREGAPLLVFFHGGYWRSLDKSDFSWIAPAFVAHGISVALVNYGLAPRTPMEEIVRQALRSLAWLWRNGDRLAYSPERIVVAGHSAGAHLTAMSMAALWPVFGADLPANLVKAGIAISGIYDLEPLVLAPFINTDLKLDVERARKLSPIHLPAPTAAPLITAVGALESDEFRRQTDLIGQAWPGALRARLSVPEANHLSVCDALTTPGAPLFHAALDLIRSV